MLQDRGEIPTEQGMLLQDVVETYTWQISGMVCSLSGNFAAKYSPQTHALSWLTRLIASWLEPALTRRPVLPCPVDTARPPGAA